VVEDFHQEYGLLLSELAELHIKITKRKQRLVSLRE